jgi:hypothetical protein
MSTDKSPSAKFHAKRLVSIIILLMAISGAAYYLFDYTYFYIEVHGGVNEFFCVVSAFVYSATAYPFYLIPALEAMAYPWGVLIGIFTGSIINALLIEFILMRYHAYKMKHSRSEKRRE